MSDLLKLFPQILQLNGLSLVWDLWCLVKCSKRLKALSHSSHLKLLIFFDSIKWFRLLLEEFVDGNNVLNSFPFDVWDSVKIFLRFLRFLYKSEPSNEFNKKVEDKLYSSNCWRNGFKLVYIKLDDGSRIDWVEAYTSEIRKQTRKINA